MGGQRIRELRGQHKWSQTELGRRIGVSKQQIMRYETQGIENMRVRRLVVMCEEFGCTVDYLLGLTEERV